MAQIKIYILKIIIKDLKQWIRQKEFELNSMFPSSKNDPYFWKEKLVKNFCTISMLYGINFKISV